MQERIHHLTVAENFFGEKLESPERVKNIFSQLSVGKRDDLYERYREYEKAWQAPGDAEVPAMHFGKAYDTIKFPRSWVPKYYSATRQVDDAESLIRLLIYVPRISIWLPRGNDICSLLCALASLRPFLADGSIELIPDRFYAEVCGWIDDKTPSEMLKLAISEAEEKSLQAILDQVPFFF